MQHCIACGTVLTRKDNERAAQFSRRKYCDRTCTALGVARQNAARWPSPPDRFCPSCGKPMVRRPGEALGRFAARKTCSRSCGIALAAPGKTVECPARVCEVCGKTFHVSPDASPQARHLHRIRRTCGRACAQALAHSASRLDLGEKACAVCGVVFDRRPDEDARDFRRRVTCGRACGSEYRLQTLLTRRDPLSPYPSGWNERHRRLIRDRDGNRCRLCGDGPGRRGLAVHHIDYDKHNLCPDNLITLCEKCHGRTNYRRGEWRECLRLLLSS